MNDKKETGKVSEFAGRREKKGDAPKLAIENQPVPGGDQGTFDRPQCGGCIHWKKQSAQGLGYGTCMMMPPTAIPVPGPNGQVAGIMNVRPGLLASNEGCDQFEDEDGNTVFEDDEDEDDPEPAAGGDVVPLKATG